MNNPNIPASAARNLQPAHVDPSELPPGFTAAPGSSTANSQLDERLELLLTPEALARFRRIQMVKPDKAAKLQNVLLSTKSSTRMTEDQLVALLQRYEQQTQRQQNETSIRIQRKKYTDDSEDDDNDDDLM